MNNISSTAGPNKVRLWQYYVSTGLVAAVAVVLFSVLPQSIAGLMLVAAAALIVVIDRLAHKYANPSPLQSQGAAYVVTVGVVVVGALVLTWTLARRSWAAWALAILVGLVICSGALMHQKSKQ